MFTVIFLSRSAKAIFDKSKTFFDPFLERNEIAFCDWNESQKAVTLHQALPRLPEIIRGKTEWRAVVVDHFTADDLGRRDAENPFDFLDNLGLHPNLVDSPHALVRISHQLLGYPSMTARGFQPIVSHRDERGQRVEADSPGGDFREVLRGLSQTHSDVRVEYREVPYAAEERSRHAELRERYRVKEVSPSEVVFIATRSRLDADERAQLHHAWRVETGQHASRFVERNDYPPASRFAVYDLLNRENSGYEQDALRFWISVLTIAVNVLPPSAFQAERLYRLGVDFSEPALGELLNSHMGRLTALRDHLDSLLSRRERAPETDVRELMRAEKVHVQFESMGGGDLVVQTTGYGLAVDEPRSEAAAWSADYDQLRANAAQFLRRPRRVLARAVFDTRAKSRRHVGQDYALSEIDRDEIEDELAKRVRLLTEPATTEILDRDRLTSVLELENERVHRHISERMRIRTIALASALVVAVWLGTFVPYLIQASARDGDSLRWSIFVVAVVVLLLAGAGIATLVWMRRRLVELLRRVNATMRSFVGAVNNGAAVFGGYLSELTTYMHARALLRGADRFREDERVRNRRIEAVRTRAIAAIEAEKRIVTSLGQPLTVRRITTGLARFDVDDPHQIGSFFRFPIGARAASFNTTGEQIRAPYDFIERLSVERVRLFERDTSSLTGKTVNDLDSMGGGD
ncbi:hypothetical protein [Microbacterium terregens]|uniref:Uncharacterized protein n=1 Tax=Microbacterium terregens TaxID=69363 RepID=A0ABV5T110_9MICO